MNRLLILFLLFSQTSCVAHKVTREDTTVISQPNTEQGLSVTKENNFSEGFQCFEPMLYALSLGIIPSHCVDTYTISNPKESNIESEYKVTTMRGWATLLLVPFSEWKFGEAKNIKHVLEQKEVETKQ